MIINLSKSTLFTVNPDVRFSDRYDVPLGTWTLLYRRHMMSDYDTDELCDLYRIKTGKDTTARTISRWIWRSEVYSQARVALDKGAEIVRSNFFGDKEMDVIREITKHLGSGGSKNTKILP